MKPMKLEDTLRALEEVAAKKEIKISYEALGGEPGGGGLCRVKGEWRLIIDKRASPGERVAQVAQALSKFPLEDVFVQPEVKQLIEQLRGQPRRRGLNEQAS